MGWDRNKIMEMGEDVTVGTTLVVIRTAYYKKLAPSHD